MYNPEHDEVMKGGASTDKSTSHGGIKSWSGTGMDGVPSLRFIATTKQAKAKQNSAGAPDINGGDVHMWDSGGMWHDVAADDIFHNADEYQKAEPIKGVAQRLKDHVRLTVYDSDFSPLQAFGGDVEKTVEHMKNHPRIKAIADGLPIVVARSKDGKLISPGSKEDTVDLKRTLRMETLKHGSKSSVADVSHGEEGFTADAWDRVAKHQQVGYKSDWQAHLDAEEENKQGRIIKKR